MATRKPKQQPKSKQRSRQTNRGKPEQKGNKGLNRVGALWISEGRNGKFMSGRLELTEGESISILVFKNHYKEEKKHPDYLIYEPENQQETSNRKKAAKEWNDDDVPF